LILPLSLSLLLAVSLTRPAAAACEGGTRPSIHVVAESTSVSVAADFRLPEISDLARRVGEPLTMAPLGFYTSTVLHKISVQVEPGPTARCEENTQIDLTIRLVNRRIEIAREIQQQSCRYPTVLRHYQKKAAADRAAFATYVNTVVTALRSTPLPMIQADMDHASMAEARQKLEQWVEDVVDRKGQSLQQARRAAFQAVDTADEMRQLAESCSQGA
jgi:hypothetical protein